nr:ATP synthase F0 subunit 8 [Teledapalpus zolotichini]
MPQMAPMNWLILFLFFIIMFFIINSLNYYIFLYDIKKNNNIMKKMKMNWKW